MTRFPTIPAGIRMKPPKMGLREYAQFSERCLMSNPAITPENCLVKRASEKTMKAAFRLKQSLEF
jgi:hypothetical protein